MEGWRIKEGKHIANEINEKQIIHKFYDFRKKSKRTLYKYFFLLSLIDNIDERNNKINFDEVMNMAIKKYWEAIYLNNKKIVKLSKKRNSKLEQIFIENINDENALGKRLGECNLTVQKNILDKSLRIFPKYVVGAIYGDFDKEIYSFDINQRELEMNFKYKDAILKNKYLIKEIVRKELEFEIDKINKNEDEK